MTRGQKASAVALIAAVMGIVATIPHLRGPPTRRGENISAFPGSHSPQADPATHLSGAGTAAETATETADTAPVAADLRCSLDIPITAIGFPGKASGLDGAIRFLMGHSQGTRVWEPGTADLVIQDVGSWRLEWESDGTCVVHPIADAIEIRGMVLNAAGEPYPGAGVHGCGGAATSGFDGTFLLFAITTEDQCVLEALVSNGANRAFGSEAVVRLDAAVEGVRLVAPARPPWVPSPTDVMLTGSHGSLIGRWERRREMLEGLLQSGTLTEGAVAATRSMLAAGPEAEDTGTP